MPLDNDRHTHDAPAAPSSLSDTLHGETEAEDVALCAWWDERRQLFDDAECLYGCEHSDGPLLPLGCQW